MSSNDPGGGPPNISDLQENLSQQQAKISALKELVRKTEVAQGKNTVSAQEKVRNIAQRLTHLKTKASRSRPTAEKIILEHSEEAGDVMESQTTAEQNEEVAAQPSRVRSETPGTDKLQLLRQQMEKNRQRMAEREHNQRDIEEMMTQLKAKFDTTQMSLERSSELGRSFGDLSLLDTSVTPANADARVKELEKQIEELTNNVDDNRVKTLESRILDLEESNKEKDCIIDARTQAVSLMSENLSLKGKTTVDLLEETKQEMFKMQNHFVQVESDLCDEVNEMKAKLKAQSDEIINLKEINDILETARFDLTIKNAELNSKLEELSEHESKVKQLTSINDALEQRIVELESQKYEFVVDDRSKETAEAANMVVLNEKLSTLQRENNDLKKSIESNVTEKSSLDAEPLDDEAMKKYIKQIQELEESLCEKNIEINVQRAEFDALHAKYKEVGPKPVFSSSKSATNEESDQEIMRYKAQLDEANKSNIKMKLKIKQLQKQIDSFKRTSDAHAELTRLTDEVQSLNHRVVELEEEKGSLQLKLISGGDSENVIDTPLEKKVQMLESACQNQSSAIQLLEEQKIDMTEELANTKAELATLKDHINTVDSQQSAHVTSHMESIALEERIDLHSAERVNLEKELEAINVANAELRQRVLELNAEKQDLTTKLEQYSSENMELLEKIDKLSIEKGSSAESIEIVEGLTVQEKLEMEGTDETDDTISNETAELRRKIDLFTKERKEVLEKMELLTAENHELQMQVAALNEKRSKLEEDIEIAVSEKYNIERLLQEAVQQKEEHLQLIADANSQNETLKSEINKLVSEKLSTSAGSSKTSSVTASPIRKVDSETVEPDAYKKTLSLLDLEIEAFRKAKDKTMKLNTSRKLAKEAKNSHVLFTELLQKYQTIVHENDQLQAEMKKLESCQSTTADDDEENRNLKLRLLEITAKELELTTAIESSQSIVHKLEKQIQELTKEAEETTTQNQRLQEQIDEYEDQRLSLCEKMEKLQKKVMTDLDEMQHLRLFADEQNKQIERMQSEITLLVEKHENASDKRLSQLRHEYEIEMEAGVAQMNILKSLVAEQKQQLIDTMVEHEGEIEMKMNEIASYEAQLQKITVELSEVRTTQQSDNESYVKQLTVEIESLKQLQEESVRLRDEQIAAARNKDETIEDMNGRIMSLYETLEKTNAELDAANAERNDFEERLDTSDRELKELNKKFLQASVEIKKANKQIDALQKSPQKDVTVIENRIVELEKFNAELETKNGEQLEKLKKFASNLKKKVAQCSELEQKLNEAETNNNSTQLKQELDDMRNAMADSNRKCVDYEHALAELTEISGQLKQELHNTSQTMIESNQRCIEYEHSLAEAKNSIVSLTASLETANEIQNEYNAVCIRLQEVQQQLNISNEKLVQAEMEKKCDHNKMEEQFKEMTEEQHKLTDSIKSRDIKLEKCKALIKDRNREIQRLKDSVSGNDSEHTRNELANKQFAIQIDNLREENRQLVDTLRQEHSNSVERYEIKYQESLNVNETLDLENEKLKEKINRLEEEMVNTEKHHVELQQKVAQLDAQLSESSDEYSKNEEILLSKLNTITVHAEQIEKKLKDIQFENQGLQENIETARNSYVDVTKKLAHVESQLSALENEQLIELERKNAVLVQQLEGTLTELRKAEVDANKKLADKHSEIDELEAELSAQLTAIEAEKRAAQEMLEKEHDLNSILQDDVVKFKESINSLEQTRSELEREMTWLKLENENLTQDGLEVQELRMQIVQDQTEIENLKQQNHQMLQNHETETTALRKQIVDLDAVRTQVGQNQTDDQAIIENENRKLKEILTQRERDIEEYQKRNLQLQMVGSTVTTANTVSTDLFAELAAGRTEVDAQIDELRQALSEKEAEIERLRAPQEFVQMKRRVDIEESQRTDLEKKMEEMERYISDLEERHQQLSRELEERAAKIVENSINTMVYEEKIRTLERTLAEQAKIKEEKQVAATAVPLLASSLFATSGPSFFDEELRPPVVEEIIVPKQAYICQPPSDECWGTEEAELEEAHQQQQVSQNLSAATVMPVSANRDLELAVQERDDTIRELESERNRLSEKIAALQVKSGKMVKKLREYKSKNDELEKVGFKKSPSVESNSLDLAIQEELSTQISQLEGTVKELRDDLEKSTRERESHLKRIDVLVAANERLIESKERQDSQIKSYHHEVKQLNDKIIKLQEWGADGGMDTTPAAINPTSETPEINVADLQAMIKDLRVDNEELQALLDDEKRNLLQAEAKIGQLQSQQPPQPDEQALLNEKDNEIEKLRNQLSQSVSDKEMEVEILQSQLAGYASTIELLSSESNNIKTALETLSEEHRQKIDENSTLSAELQLLAAKKNEITTEIDRMKVSSFFDMPTESCSDLSQRITVLEADAQNLIAQNQYKDAEIVQLNQKIREVIEQDQTASLVNEILAKNHELNQLKVSNQELQQSLSDKDATIATQSQEPAIDKVAELEKIVTELKNEKSAMEEELQVLNDQVLSSIEFEDNMKKVILETDAKNIEIQELRHTLERMGTHTDNDRKAEQEALVTHWTAMVEQRGNEVADCWRQHVEQRENEFHRVEEALRAEIKTQSDHIQPEVANNEMMGKMQAALESQELEIVTLKEQLAVRSAEYARLCAQLDPFGHSATSNMASVEPKVVKRTADLSNVRSTTPAAVVAVDTVPRSELDLALYMLHQRDMRCEEMTHELISLLEERDTLQLKWSNSIRQLENIREQQRTKGLNVSDNDQSDSNLSKPSSPEKSTVHMAKSDNVDGGGGVVVDDVTASAYSDLKAKLSELQTVTHSRDKQLREERGQRHRQMDLLQRDVANMPAEAVAELVGSDYSPLTQTSESTSTVLLNWLWGKSNNNNSRGQPST